MCVRSRRPGAGGFVVQAQAIEGRSKRRSCRPVSDAKSHGRSRPEGRSASVRSQPHKQGPTIPRMSPDRMPAAVYVGDGEIAVRDLDVPDLSPAYAESEVA